ncbi:MAG: DIP1984 family protein [Egibacteraceae bacterium]
MLLAEALRERADAQRQLAALRDRVAASARYTEGEEVAEDASALLDEAEALVGRLAELMLRINETNLQATLADGRSLTAALAERDALRTRSGLLKSTADAAAGGRDTFRCGRQELRTFAALDVTALRRRADDVARQIRELDLAIEQVNFSTGLEGD